MFHFLFWDDGFDLFQFLYFSIFSKGQNKPPTRLLLRKRIGTTQPPESETGSAPATIAASDLQAGTEDHPPARVGKTRGGGGGPVKSRQKSFEFCDFLFCDLLFFVHGCFNLNSLTDFGRHVFLNKSAKCDPLCQEIVVEDSPTDPPRKAPRLPPRLPRPPRPQPEADPWNSGEASGSREGTSSMRRVLRLQPQTLRLMSRLGVEVDHRQQDREAEAMVER